MTRNKRILIYSKDYAGAYRTEVFNTLNNLNGFPIDVFMDEDLYDKLNHEKTLPSIVNRSTKGRSLQDIDLLVSLGGDGTFLETSLMSRDYNTPILGVNIGRLGFLARVTLNDVGDSIESFIKGEFDIEHRSVIELDSTSQSFGEQAFGLNEFTIHKKDSSSMIIIHTYVDGEFLASYWADGLIICTPTGSTAYSMRCGGPIIAPGSNNFLITPIAPHNLNLRPIVIPDTSEISFELEGRSDEFLITLDSRIATVNSSERITIRKSDRDVRIIRTENDNFFNTLRQKLHWGLDRRN